MDRVDALLHAYTGQASMPWRPGLSGPERVWMAVYPPELERRVRGRLHEFEAATKASGHSWVLCDLTRSFSSWMASHPHRERYFKNPSLLTPSLSQFLTSVEASIRETANDATDEDTVLVLLGVASLFPMIRVSDLLGRVAPVIKGRLLVLFPGSFENGNYRLLDARDGWNYLAIPITISEGGAR